MMRGAGVLVSIGVIGWLMPLATATAPPAEWPALPPLPVGPFVMLTEGGIRAGLPTSIDESHVVLDSPAAGEIRLPRRSVAGFRASLAVEPVPAAHATPQARAVITFTNGDVVAAQAVTLRDGAVSFTTARDSALSMAVPLSRVLAIDFPLAAAAASPSRSWQALDDGSRFASDASALPGTRGVVATVTEDDAWRFLTSLEPSSPAAAMQPAWPAVRGTTGFTACRLHAPARVAYRFAKPAARLRAVVAIDDSAGQGGSVVVSIRTGSDGERRDAFTSAVIRGGDEPLAVDVPLDGAREVELVVDPADAGTVLDRTIWLDPRIEFQ